MNYLVQYADQARAQLREIGAYIEAEADDIEVAIGVVNSIDHAILLLSTTPYMGRVPLQRFLIRKGYRTLLTGHYLVFYTVDETEHTVMVHAVVDGRRDYMRFI